MNTRVVAETDIMLDALSRRRASWSPHKPWPKQQQWIDLDVLESCYGGAAGGGKSDALLASALRFVDRPQYKALILRRTFADLNLPDAIMARSHEWLDNMPGVTWSERDHRWTFSNGAVLQFGFCDTKQDLARYKSAAFHFIGVDELTEWPELWYTFLFSRIRRLAGDTIPLRMRSATNPDGLGQLWVQERFGIPENTHIEAPIWINSTCAFWPARAEDNPSLDLPAYEASLERMTGGREGVRWKQLREGLWIRDDSGLVYSFQGETGRARNVRIDEERKRGVRWHFLLGIDYGFNDETAFVVLGWREHESTVYVVESEKHTELTPSDAAQHVTTLTQRYAFDRIVGDTGGLGKGYVEEARNRFGLPIEAAEKQNKRGYIDLLNGALKKRQLLVLPGNEALEHEWRTLPWAEGRQKEHDGFANHLADATLYAWRAAWAYREKPKVEKDTSLEAREREEEERLANELDRDAKRGGRSWARRMLERR